MMTRIYATGLWMLTVLLCSTWLARAEAAQQDFNQLLRGDYAFTGEAVCLASSGFTDFIPNTTPRVISFSIQGIRTFNGDGTGSIVARTVDFRHPPAPLLSLMAGGAADISADFTYQVAPDRTFTVNQGPVTRTVVAGPAGEIGETSIINGIKFSGYISHDLKTLVMSTNSPTVETRTDEDGNILDYRICHRARTAVKIK